ncbi:MAG: phage terminase large subunit family protein [Chloroflexota bacterium]|nr:phage terminase large subunit family protein [Chloroflexota bacterium]
MIRQWPEADLLELHHYRRVARPVRNANGDDLLEWTQQHRRWLGPERVFDLAHHAYLAALYGVQAGRAAVMKAAQMGASEWLISYALHACDQRNATALYVFPTDAHVSDFSAARLGPAIEASPYLESIIVDGRALGGKRGSDRVTLKRVRNRFLYFRGGQVKPDGSAPQLKSIDADVLILDELDELDPRAPAIAAKRLGHSSIGEMRLVSTPSYPGGGIHAEWQESDQRLWHVRCGACGLRQPLAIEQAVTEWDDLGRPRAWRGQAEGRAWAACVKCGSELDRLGPGEWVAAHPGRETAGFHLSKLFSARTPLLDVVRALDTTDETKRREAFNQDLGLPYRPRGGGLDGGALDDCRREYGHGPRPEGSRGAACYMGVDVGKVLHVVIRAAADKETGERRQLFAGEVSWDGLALLMRQYGPRAAVMDALPETTKAREFQRQFARGRVWLAYYPAQASGSKREDFAAWDWAQSKVDVDRTRSLDETLARFTDGSNTLPANARDIRDYYAHLTATVRVIEKDARGQEAARYVETGPDHFAHAENYCTVAAECPAAAGWARGAAG